MPNRGEHWASSAMCIPDLPEQAKGTLPRLTHTRMDNDKYVLRDTSFHWWWCMHGGSHEIDRSQVFEG